MEFKGEVKEISMNYESGEYQVTVTCPKASLPFVEELKEKALRITFKIWRKKRSNDANAYAWVLMQKIAEKVDSDRWSVYLELLKKYSRAFTFVIVKPDAIDRMKEQWRECIDLGEVEMQGQKGHQLQLFYGSSTFDSKEMAVFIEGIVRECEQLEIETIPPEELERMVSMWNQ